MRFTILQVPCTLYRYAARGGYSKKPPQLMNSILCGLSLAALTSFAHSATLKLECGAPPCHRVCIYPYVHVKTAEIAARPRRSLRRNDTLSIQAVYHN